MFIKLFLTALPVFFVIDMLWLVLVAKNFYQKQIGFLMKPDVNWVAAIIFAMCSVAVASRSLIGSCCASISLSACASIRMSGDGVCFGDGRA